MDMASITIYNLPPAPAAWDNVGIFFISYCSAWTAIVMAGMAFCLYNRHLPSLRVRGLPLSFLAITFLHLYWIMAQITYPVGRTLPAVIAYDVQYFVMGMWFPLGIALFHAANLRFLRVAKLQKQFTHPDLRRKRGCNGSKTSWLCRLRNLDYTTKVMSFIATGMVVQILLCLGMWLACKKYHPSFGIPGTDIRGATVVEQLIDLGRGWEWWPSVLWQLVWTWIVAPILIWKSWNIRDTMGWRVQTIGACLSGLHATPMFLIASYVPAFYKINMYFTPSQWIHLNTMFIEVFTVFVPAYEVVRVWLMSKQVASSNARWENDSSTSTIQVSSAGSGYKRSEIDIVESDQIHAFMEEHADRLLTMTALNRVLDEHPEPLQEFSAHRDFSGENIAFLTHLKKWRAELPGNDMTADQRSEAFNSALALYIDFISPRDAEFPLNLSSHHFRELEEVFGKATRAMCGAARPESVVPFAFDLPLSRSGSDSSGSSDATTLLHEKYTGDIPTRFCSSVFDDIERHIKTLVLTNTWPKFVREMQARRRRSVDSEASGMTGATGRSDATVVSFLTKWVRSLV
ncbi:putative GprK-type G-protein coupled receptor protein [Corynespora cassiicola Philippines]|uniref:Putative GprK-type G-protein coupled receptor protein n=1 Tax=Corynespora cassiicola Philippines TaxID=1448308 RepID=A0A2T2N335_CORCC|nr:putative GprK-type G-protein coupled receptor protein [Corynespora cassiicola Philippines]